MWKCASLPCTHLQWWIVSVSLTKRAVSHQPNNRFGNAFYRWTEELDNYDEVLRIGIPKLTVPITVSSSARIPRGSLDICPWIPAFSDLLGCNEGRRVYEGEKISRGYVGLEMGRGRREVSSGSVGKEKIEIGGGGGRQIKKYLAGGRERSREGGCSNRDSVISFSLYGEDERYSTNLLRNVELRDLHFSGWRIVVYYSTDDRYRVPQKVLKALNESRGVSLIDVSESSLAPMLWRFLEVDNVMEVRNYLSRDADSLLSAREACAVRAWLRDGAIFNCIRDHPSHARYPLSGGLWGTKTTEFLAILKRNGHRSFQDWMANERVGNHYLQDMDFLNHHVWPLVEKYTYCSDSVSCERYHGSNRFPVERSSNWEHVGQVFDVLGRARQNDINLLKNAVINTNCTRH